MSTLSNAIRTENLIGTAAEVLAALLTNVVLSTDSITYSLSGAADRLLALGVDPMILIDLRAHVRTLPVGGDTFEGLLLTGGGSAGGVNFSLPAIRFQIQVNQAQPSTTVAQQIMLAAMLQIGETTGPLWRKYISVEPVEAEVQSALDIIVAENEATAAAHAKSQLRVWLSQRRDEIDLQIIADQLTTQEAVKAAWSE